MQVDEVASTGDAVGVFSSFCRGVAGDSAARVNLYISCEFSVQGVTRARARARAQSSKWVLQPHPATGCKLNLDQELQRQGCKRRVANRLGLR